MYKLLLSLVLIATSALPAEAELPKEPGTLLREGTWSGDVGTYGIPSALADVKPSRWPKEGWYRLTLHSTSIESQRVEAPRTGAPAFLQTIVSQIESAQNEAMASQAAPVPSSEEALAHIYLRVPGSRLREGSLPTYVFKNGTSTLRPKLDYRYELTLGEQAFAFVAMNGYRSASGVPYGEGARYSIEYDGNTYEYELGGFGWDSAITAIADLDGDGKPDFVISVGGSNSSSEAVLLSSQAKPGKNPATASLSATGC